MAFYYRFAILVRAELNCIIEATDKGEVAERDTEQVQRPLPRGNRSRSLTLFFGRYRDKRASQLIVGKAGIPRET